MANSSANGLPNGGTTQKTPLQNQTLDQLYAESDTLTAVMKANADSHLDVYRAAADAYGEIQDRITTLLNLQLAADTAAMENLIPAIQSTKADFDAVLKNIAKASDVVEKAGKFLGVIDDLIAAAKVAATL